MSGKPIASMAIFFQALSQTMYEMNTAKTTKTNRLYMPEHAISTANDIFVLAKRIVSIAGVPKLLEIQDRTTREFTIAFAASVLITLSVKLILLRMSDGGGVRKSMKAIENMRWRRVWG